MDIKPSHCPNYVWASWDSAIPQCLRIRRKKRKRGRLRPTRNWSEYIDTNPMGYMWATSVDYGRVISIPTGKLNFKIQDFTILLVSFKCNPIDRWSLASSYQSSTSNPLVLNLRLSIVIKQKQSTGKGEEGEAILTFHQNEPRVERLQEIS